jgi:hypothetical protein
MRLSTAQLAAALFEGLDWTRVYAPEIDISKSALALCYWQAPAISPRSGGTDCRKNQLPNAGLQHCENATFPRVAAPIGSVFGRAKVFRVPLPVFGRAGSR